MLRVLVCLFLSLSAWVPTLQATDCNSDCRKNCTSSATVLGRTKTWVDGLCHARCISEKELACSTGFTSCDTWKVSGVSPYFYAAIKSIEEANRQEWRPHDEHDCQMGIDQLASAGTAGGAGSRLYTAYEYGVKAALAVNKATVISYLVTEGVKHFLHCACSSANYVEAGSGNSGTSPSTPGRDTYYVSRMRKSDGKWAERQGKAPNRNTLLNEVNGIMNNRWEHSQSGYFDASQRTITEAECEEGHRFYIENGGTSSLTACFNDVKARGWTACLFRVRNTRYGVNNVPIADRYYSSMASSRGGWSLHHGPNSDAANIKQKTQNGVSGNISGEKSGRYSSSRRTITRTGCDISSSSSGGLTTSESVVYLTSGKGDGSLTKAFKIAQDKGYSGCVFKVEDVGFSSLDE